MQTDHSFSRKDFLRSCALLMGGAFGLSSFGINAAVKPKLAFSTLGCPDWDLLKITSFARANGYTGLELRGIQREMNLPQSPAFSSAANIAQTKKLMKEKGLKFVGLGSSSTLHFADPSERKKQLDEGRRFIDLAQQLECPYVRVFPNNLPKDQDRQQTLDLITRGLTELADHCKGSNVTVLMETHGDLVYTADILQVMNAVKHPHAALLWDVANMWTITGEDPVDVYRQLKPFIRHVHVKDARKNGDKLEYTLLQKGDVPIMKAIDAMAAGGYKGYYSFEWEKLWHPEIMEPEIALADFPAVMKNHFK